jgi:RNA polymerase sigma factor (sigma-70 family)
MNPQRPTEDPEPIEDLVRWAGRIATGIARAKRVPHLADLARSAAFEALARKLDSYDDTRASFRTYAVQGIVGAVLDEIGPAARRLSVEVAFAAVDEVEGVAGEDASAEALASCVMEAIAAAYVGEELPPSAEAGLLRGELVRRLHAHVAGLAKPDRKLVVLRYWEGKTWDDVAASLGVSTRTAKEHDLRVRTRLKDLLSKDEDDKPPGARQQRPSRSNVTVLSARSSPAR